MRLFLFSCAVLAASVGLWPRQDPKPGFDVETLKGVLARIDVKKTYDAPGVQSGPNLGTAIVISANCESIYLATAAHLLKPRADLYEADFTPQVTATLYVDRATPRAARVVRDFSSEAPSQDLVVLEIRAGALVRNIPRLSVRGQDTPLADGEALFAFVQGDNNDAPVAATTAVTGAPHDVGMATYAKSSIQSGFSGGPVLDRTGRLVAMHLEQTEGKTNGEGLAGYVLLGLLQAAAVRTSNLEGADATTRDQHYVAVSSYPLGGGFSNDDFLEFSAARQSYGPYPFPHAIPVSVDWSTIRPDQKVVAQVQVAVEPTGAGGRASIFNVSRNPGTLEQGTPEVDGMRDTTRPAAFRLEIQPDCGVQTYKLEGERIRRTGESPNVIYGSVWATGSIDVLSPSVPLGGDASKLVPFVKADTWQPVVAAQDVTVDWSSGQYTGITAYVTVRLYAFSYDALPAVSVRLREITTDRVVARRDGMTNHTTKDMVVPVQLSGSRDSGRRQYRLEVSLTDANEHASVIGYLVLERD